MLFGAHTGRGEAPWCVGHLAFPGDDARLPAQVSLHVAKAVTDWRADRSGAPDPHRVGDGQTR